MNRAKAHASLWQRRPEAPKQPRLLYRLMMLLTAGIVVIGLLTYLFLSDQANRQTATALMTLADSGAQTIARWHGNQFAHARQIQNDPLLAEALTNAETEDGLGPLRGWMRAQRDAFGYQQILLLRPDLSPLAADPTESAGHANRPDLDTERAMLARVAFADGEPRLTALHGGEIHTDGHLRSAPHLGLIVPLPQRPGHATSPVAGLVLRIDPARSLTPIIKQTSAVGVGGQLLLLVEDSQWNVNIINPSVLDQYSAADRERLLTRFNDLFLPGRPTPDQPIRISTSEPTYTVVRATTNPAWRLLALMPASQFESAARRVGQAVLLITALALTATATGIGLVWSRQRWLTMQDRVRWSEALELERTQLKQLFDAVDEIIYVADPDSFDLLYANDYFRRLLHPDPIGKKCYQVLQQRDSPCPFCTNEKIFGEYLGQSYVWEFQNEVTKRWYRCADKAIRWPDGRMVRFEIALDITEQRASLQQHIELEKLGAIGRLTAGFAHELNNPLMGIINAIQFCVVKTAAEDERHQVLTNAEHHTRRCIDIVQRLLTFSHGGNERKEPLQWVDALALVEEIGQLLAYRFRQNAVELVIDAGDDLGSVQLRPNSFEQVAMNLVTNALDAVAETPRRRIRIGLSVQSEEFLFTVQDSGVGISEANKARIFEPFFTTKPVGSGTGLGLSTTWALVTEQGGRLQVDSTPGIGTCMTAIFPQPATPKTTGHEEAAATV